MSEQTEAPSGRRWNRRTWTVLFSFGLVIVFALIGIFVRVPYVAVGPGPTFNTLGKHNGADVIEIGTGPKTYPTTGQLRMTTVSLTDNLSLFAAMGLWLGGREALAPREAYFPPGQSRQQVNQQNTQEFESSQSNAEVAALSYLHFPSKVFANTIVNGGPSDKKIKAGDQILAIGGKNVTTAKQVFDVMRKTKPGQSVDVKVTAQHGGQPRDERIKLGRNPQGDFGFLGLTPTNRADVPFNIGIRLNDVGGPSAGLIFALSIIDKLTPDQLTDGKTIAGTGEIDSEGRVGQIGGINFKLIAAKEQGASAFLVPAGNCVEAKATAPDGLQLVKVGSLSDAVTDLRKLRSGQAVPHC
ncbi:PDZ domain-containing protein [Sciscionella marina]|uniref:YlbL family protein n=1 Tax=Sciscionella marina TaxID=508770 RepID=UPI00146E7543|nr:PDZ domain-containing protein [Sciscionella marina]